MKMCCSFLATKLLVLKILIIGFTGLVAASNYAYGYHPSAEEFDHILSETSRTWTHSLLKAQRDRAFTNSAQRRHDTVENRLKNKADYFVPKFQYENNESKKFQQIIQNPLTSPDLHLDASQKYTKPLKNVASVVHFNYFSPELPKPFSTTPLNMQDTLVGKPTGYTTTIKPSSEPKLSLKPLAEPDILNNNKYSLNNLYRNNTQGNFPIYFTNPATGIVYAITEMGKTAEGTTNTNGTIPIFISKEQYEKDIQQLKNEYKEKCENLQASSTTSRPKIIAVHRPTTSKFSLNPASLNPMQSPSPVVIKTELIVKDQKPSNIARPSRRKKKKPKGKHKLKKKNHILTTTIKTLLANHADGPAIIMGSRTHTENPYGNNEKLSTQVEKPGFDNIFSSAAVPVHHSARSLETQDSTSNSHRIHKRSLEQKSAIVLEMNKSHLEKAMPNNSSKLEATPIQNYSDSLFKGFTKTKTFKENLFGPKEEQSLSNMHFSKEKFPNSQNVTEGSVRKPTNDLQSVVATNSSTSENKIKKELTRISTPNSKTQRFSMATEHFIIPSAASQSNTFNTHHSPRNLYNSSSSNVLTTSKLRISDSNSARNLSTKLNSAVLNRNDLKGHNFPLINGSAIRSTNTSSFDHNFSETNSTVPKFTGKANSERSKIREYNFEGSKLNKKLPIKKMPPHKYQKLRRKWKRKPDTEYYTVDQEDNYEDDDSDDEDSEEDDEEDYGNDEDIVDVETHREESQEEYPNKVLDYYEEPSHTHTSDSTSTTDDLTRKPALDTTSFPQTESQNNAFISDDALNYENDVKIDLTIKPSYINKRIRRRPLQVKISSDYEDEDDDNNMGFNLADFFRMIFYPIQVIMSTVMDSFAIKDADEKNDDVNFNPYTQYTSYHNTLNQQSSDEYDDDYDSAEADDSSLTNWFRSWFALKRRNKKIGTTTAAPLNSKPIRSSSWLPSWLSPSTNDRISTETVPNEDYSEYDKWFASWFGDTRPKARRRTATSTSTTTQLPHVPILTIVDPNRNPQNWIGLLAHHIINYTTTTNPLKDMWSKAITTTTENPEMPRKVSYDKYQIWRLKPQDEAQLKALEEYKHSVDGIKLQWLKGPSLRGLTDVLVPPRMLVDFQASLTFELVDHEVLIFDVGKAIAYEKTKEDYFFATTQKPKKHTNKHRAPVSGMTWHKYYEYDDIIKYLETMRMRFPHLVELIHIGRSYEGRPLIVTKIESREAAAVNAAHYPAHQRNKLRHRKRIGLANAVFIEAGIHGMEWIGPATATWIINELLKIMKRNVTDNQSFVRNTTWYIMPVLNPDGYVYSHEYDRFWKKSRSRHIYRPSGILNSAITWLKKKRIRERICFGVDLDRNWHYQWGRRGSSKSVCNEFYAGPTPFSEPETKALSEFLMDYRTQIKLFVSLQAYGQIISYPYKANTTYDTERLDDLLDVAMVGTDGLRKKGSKTRYKVDSSNDLIENRSGCSDAFAAYEAGIPFSYTLQLADNGVHGYLLPSASIESTAKDSFEIITGMLDYI